MSVTKALVSMDPIQRNHFMLIEAARLCNMHRLECRSVADGDNRGAGQSLAQQAVDQAFGGLVE